MRIAAAIAAAGEATMRSVMEQAADSVDPLDVDEVILQSYLFAGFPRALNAARIWRAVLGKPAPLTDAAADIANAEGWVSRGAETCATVYGDSYHLLRENIRALHPALDAWMIVDGYGKVLSRPQLDLKSRELCIVAACAASMQQRQLHSHLHGALNCGATSAEVADVLDLLHDFVDSAEIDRYRGLLFRVLSRRQSLRPTELE